ncbi:MAG TPA: oleate hydratase [Candidatus Rifleibacterium sp.]|nr:oleate hydratase [Candidatus Rifleibacterium sp.]HPT48310.1 oleate hydratase [Candidatus Rifleibacterium sp.]
MNYNNAHIAGNGLAGLATAFYLVNDSQIEPRNITVYGSSAHDGGSLDAFDISAQNHYFMRGFRMLESKVYSAFFSFISKIPLHEKTDKSLFDDFIEFNREVKTFSQSRLIEAGQAIDARRFKLRFSDRVKILLLLAKSESAIEKLTISDFFSPAFFSSNFWIEFATTFSFQPWHSLEEFKRYILRFLQCSPVLDSQTCIRSTRYNQYDSVVKPTKNFLQSRGVNFVYNSQITGAGFREEHGKLSITNLEMVTDDQKAILPVNDNDLVFLTLGSMTAFFSAGSMNTPPPLPTQVDSCAWNLWKNIAAVSDTFGNPELFMADTRASRWVSFTMTFSNPIFFSLLEKITRTTAGREGPITIKDSNWLISFALPNQPHFVDQPGHLQILWGYGMHSDAPGNFIKKTLPECTGAEILYELVHHLHFEHHLEEILQSATCIPCMLPLITSQFLPRQKNDRPAVVPDCAKNFAFIGQYCEIPDDIVFTLEYSVRSAQIAVFTYLNKLEKVAPIYKGWRRLSHLFDAFRTVFR